MVDKAQKISDLEFVAFDTETTGLQPSSEHLIEIAAVRFSLSQGPLEYFETLIKPPSPIPHFATQVNGITNEMVNDAPTIAQVMPNFLSFIENSVTVAHNAPFDIGFIALHAMRLGLTVPEVLVLDSCTFSRRTLKEQSSHKLENLATELGFARGGFHRALDDTKYCMQLFEVLVDRSCGREAKLQELLAKQSKFHFFNKYVKKINKLPTKLAPIISALRARKQIWIEYQNGYGPHPITPLTLYDKNKTQYLEAMCHIHDHPKSFRLDRIERIVLPE